ncbi:Crp/Fnr family transcriptional regulator [Sphingobium mellinum]|uniref:Crp/Fnr family transcriptional regulator n=1 Tax=Sphingobium mellinum TaxID=1387166 RepID=UPI0030ED1060
MIRALGARGLASSPVIRRLGALAPLDKQAVHALQHALECSFSVAPRHELLREGQPISRSAVMVSGWAARTRCLEDGRRQIINFVLPGDLVGFTGLGQPLASSTIVAITDATLCPLPDPSLSASLNDAYAVSRALDEAHLLGQITRLGRLSAQERIQDLLLELLERLELAGLARDGRYPIPLTQEMLADALGLTPVHVNRMLQQARQAGELSWHGGEVILHDPKAIRRKVGRLKIRVSRPMV